MHCCEMFLPGGWNNDPGLHAGHSRPLGQGHLHVGMAPGETATQRSMEPTGAQLHSHRLGGPGATERSDRRLVRTHSKENVQGPNKWRLVEVVGHACPSSTPRPRWGGNL
jgi:hypothetical protein